MSYTDKTLVCADCAKSFTFSISEQEQFASRGFVNEPKRCTECRETRRQHRGSSSFGGQSSYGSQGQRAMFPAVCASCSKQTQVPFEPRNGRPVYCSNCYSRVRVTAGSR